MSKGLASVLILAVGLAEIVAAQTAKKSTAGPKRETKALEANLTQMANGGGLAQIEENVRMCDRFIARVNSATADLSKARSTESQLLALQLKVIAAVLIRTKGTLEKEGRAAVSGLADLWRTVQRQDSAAFQKSQPIVRKRLAVVRQEMDERAGDLRKMAALQPSFDDLSRAVLRGNRILVNPLLYPDSLAGLVETQIALRFQFEYEVYLIAMPSFLRK